jgi:hypothetical protein
MLTEEDLLALKVDKLGYAVRYTIAVGHAPLCTSNMATEQHKLG